MPDLHSPRSTRFLDPLRTRTTAARAMQRAIFLGVASRNDSQRLRFLLGPDKAHVLVYNPSDRYADWPNIEAR